MADLPEVAEWTPGIYQFETSDPVLGGPEGIDNRPSKQLANRTAWLKQRIASLETGDTVVGKAGVLAEARTIAITGDASWSVSFSGGGNVTAALTLANSGVAAGAYGKVSVNAKGLVVAGSALGAADIPNLDWSKITTGKPSTLAGYGISDAQPLDSDLTALASLVTLGLYANTGVGTAAARSIASGAGISVSNGDGVAGNPTIALSVSGIAAGTYTKLTADQYGRVTAGSSLSAADIPALDWSKVTTGKPDTLAGYGITVADQTQAEAGTDNTKPMTPLRVFQAIAKVVTQATEAALGWAKVATQAQVNAGALDDVIVTPKKLRAGFSVLLASVGYIAFPSWMGGLILQWGNGPVASATSDVAVTFPLAFPSNIYLFMPVHGYTAGSGSIAYMCGAASSLTQGTVRSTSSSLGFYWIAIGR